MRSLTILLFVFPVFVFCSTQSQVKIGLKLGINNSRTIYNDCKSDPSGGLMGGICTEIALEGNFFIQSGFQISDKSSFFRFPGSFIPRSGIYIDINPIFLEIPVNALYKLPLGPVEFLFLAGPYLAYGIGGGYKWRLDSGKIKFGYTENSDLKPIDHGVIAGTGIQFKRVQFTIQYEHGFTDLGLKKPDKVFKESYKIRNMVFSIVYLFGKGK